MESFIESQQMAETRLRTLPLAFTNEIITIYAEAAKKYWGMWGPLGQPAICSVEIWRRSQQQYLEALEAILVPPGILQTSQKAGTPLRDSLRDFFTGFGVGFDN